MAHARLPRKAYDEVESSFIRDEIQRGSFHDLEHRQYVNRLVDIEWYTIDWDSTRSTGLSAFGVTVTHWRNAALNPEAYDTVRRQTGGTTRADHEWSWRGDTDPEERRRVAARHAEDWQAVKAGAQRPPAARTEFGSRGHRSFAPFRSPVLPYDSIQSEFIREEIQRGSFDDIEYRQYVNELAWIEWYTTDWDRGSSFGPVVKNWKLAALHPEAFDIVRRELGEETRTDLLDDDDTESGEGESSDDEREYHEAWRAVQEPIDR